MRREPGPSALHNAAKPNITFATELIVLCLVAGDPWMLLPGVAIIVQNSVG